MIQAPSAGDYQQYQVLRNNQDRLICAGTATGQVVFYDTNDLKVVHTVSPHGGSITDIDVVDNILVTCGWSQR